MYTNRVFGTAKCVEVSSFQGVELHCLCIRKITDNCTFTVFDEELTEIS